MWHSAFDVLAAGFWLALSEMGATLLGAVIPLGVFAVGSAVIWFRGGRSAVNRHLKEKIGLNVLLFAGVWIALIGFSTLRVIYDDHLRLVKVAQERLAEIDGTTGRPGLRAQIDSLHAEIDGKDGLREQLTKAQIEMRLAQSQFEILKAIRTPESKEQPQRDPDGLYQFGNLVARLTGERIDEANNEVVFATLTAFGHFDRYQNADFRNLSIHCDAIGGPPPNTIVGMYLGMTAGGTCKIVGLRQP